MKKVFKTIIVLFISLFLMAGIYVSDFYHASDRALDVLDKTGVRIIEDNRFIVFVPDSIEAGIIFYPGAKVDFRSYSELFYDISRNGILCIIASMPLNLAVLDMDRADEILERYPGIDRWYMAGHSLGGAIAERYVADRDGVFEGLILMGAYCDVDLSNKDLRVLSFAGSKDGVLERDRYEQGKALLPKGSIFIEIEGGNHCQYGDYGFQKGDDEASISYNEQRRIVADGIVSFIKGG